MLLLLLVLGVLVGPAIVPATHLRHEDARENKAKADVTSLADATRWHRRMYGKLPAELADLLRKDAQGRSALENLPRDPWDHDYELRRSDAPGSWEVASLGPDGVESEDDITSKVESVK